MADIIKGRFGEPRDESLKRSGDGGKENPQEFNPETKKAFERAIEAAKNGDQNGQEIAYLGFAVEHALRMERYLDGLKDFVPAREVLATHEKHWMALPTKDLVSAIVTSTEKDWQADANSYVALRAEHANRIRRLLENFRK